MDRATLEAWARGEAAPPEAAAAASEAAAAEEEEAKEDATGPDLAMEGEVSFEAEEEGDANQTEAVGATPLLTPPSDAELLYENASLRVARPEGYWNKAPPTELATARSVVTDLNREADHSHVIASDGTVVHGSSTPVVDRYTAAQATAAQIKEIAPAVTDASAQPGGPWAPPLFNSLPEVDRATLYP